MGEWCTKGWTPKMGSGADGFPIEGACASWQPVSTLNQQTRKTEEVYDCSVFGWGPDLLTEIAHEVSQGAASTDKVANQIHRSRAEFIGALPAEAKDRLVQSDVKLVEGDNGNQRSSQ